MMSMKETAKTIGSAAFVSRTYDVLLLEDDFCEALGEDPPEGPSAEPNDSAAPRVLERRGRKRSSEWAAIFGS